MFAISTSTIATPIWANNFFMGAVPIMSSFTPTKKSTITVAITYLKSEIAVPILSTSNNLFAGNHKAKANIVPAKIFIPPIVGIFRLCNLRSSPGSSLRFFSLAILINEGVNRNTTTKEVRKDSMSISTILQSKL